MELKVGDRVRIKNRRGRNWNHDGKIIEGEKSGNRKI